MAVFKSWFITPYLVANALVCLVAVWFAAHGSSPMVRSPGSA